MNKTASKLNISTRFMMFRVKNNLSQGEVARELGLHRPTISEIEAGRQNLSIEIMISFCELINITPNKFLGIE